ncbi:MAG: serine/threonine protein kinase [Myxococcales bacterium]|nr:serine/threonine protein kinase [Myxococcales bacterium]
MIGQTLGSYTIERELGRGGMGAVYLAVHAMLGRKAAVKLLRPELSRDPSTVQRFFTEARAASAIKHPSIVEIYDFGVAPDGAAYIVMELLDGESLATRLARLGRLPVATALVFARQIATALAAAHRAGIVHRDLKPDNAFLVADPEVAGGERVKLLDFGIAKLTGDGGVAHTTTGAIMGTPHYMSPEQCEGSRAVDHRADLYSLGCMLFQMITGRLPFEGDGVGGIIGMHLYVAPPALRTLAPDAPAAVEALVARLLAKDPAGRPASADELAAQLGQLGATSGAPVVASTPAPAVGAPIDLGVAATLPNTPIGAVRGPAPTAPAASALAASAPPKRRAGAWIAAAVVLVAGGAAIVTRGGGGGARAIDAGVPADAAVFVDAAGPDAGAEALYAQAQQAIADRRWDTALALARDLGAADHPMAPALLDQAQRGKRAADAVAAMAAALAVGDYHTVRVNLDVVYDFTLDGDPDRAKADDLLAQARPAALEKAEADVARLVKAGACMDARTVAARAAADWGADAANRMTTSAQHCRARATPPTDPPPTDPPPTDPPPTDLPPLDPPPSKGDPDLAALADAVAAAVRDGQWAAAVKACAKAPLARAPKDLRLGLAIGCGLAACNVGDGKLAARALAIVPAARRGRVIQACIDHGVLLPLDLITPAKP